MARFGSRSTTRTTAARPGLTGLIRRGPLLLGGVLVVVGLVVFGSLFLRSWRSTPVDSIGLHYSGGPIEGQRYQSVVEPGSGARFLGLLDTLVLLPVTQVGTGTPPG